MRLIVHELETSLTQEMTSDHTRHQVVTIRPHLYRHGSPDGTIKVQVKDSGGTLIAESDSRNIADIGSGTYWHGYAQFDVSAMLDANTVYQVVLVASGYTFAESAYLGWCNAFDLGKYDATYTPEGGLNAPLDFEVWSRKQRMKGVV